MDRKIEILDKQTKYTTGIETNCFDYKYSKSRLTVINVMHHFFFKLDFFTYW